jgi:hypothetical protein
LGFEFLLGIAETFLCSIPAPQVKVVPLLDALQWFVGTQMYFEKKKENAVS